MMPIGIGQTHGVMNQTDFLSRPTAVSSQLDVAYLILMCALAMLVLPVPLTARAQLPTVASINLCTDQLVLSLAEPGQILSLSWLAADPEESMLADAAAAYPLNYGSAEELIGIAADVVIAGSQTSPFTRQMLTRLGQRVVEVEPATSLDDVVRNIARVGAAIGRDDYATAVIGSFRARIAALRAARTGGIRSAIVVRPGGFTIGRETLASELLGLAGLQNSVAELDRWGSLAVETLLTEEPEYIVLTRYRDDEASLANSIFSHPGLARLAESQARIEVEARYFACGAPDSLVAAERLLAQLANR